MSGRGRGRSTTVVGGRWVEHEVWAHGTRFVVRRVVEGGESVQANPNTLVVRPSRVVWYSIMVDGHVIERSLTRRRAWELCENLGRKFLAEVAKKGLR